MRKSTVRRAFTLVEVLVVLAIIALLSALLFSAFSKAREGGRRTVCLSNQKQILLALQQYESDSAGSFPYAGDFIDEGWVNRLLPYVQSPQMFLCPSDGDIEEKTSRGYVTSLDGVKSQAVPSSFIVNQRLLSSGVGHRDARNLMVSSNKLVSTVVQPATTVFLTDGTQQAFPQPPFWVEDAATGCSAESGVYGYFLQEPSQSHLVSHLPGATFADCYAPNSRHLGRANVGFVDGHIKSMENSTWYFPDTPYLDPSRGG